MRQANGEVRVGGSVNNRDVEEVRNYHAATKHSYWSVRLGGHFLDWANKPRLYKVYQGCRLSCCRVILRRRLLRLLTPFQPSSRTGRAFLTWPGWRRSCSFAVV